MTCPVCSGPQTSLYFSKDFQGECGLHRVDYHRCADCAFVWSPTIWDLPETAFLDLNRQFHAYLSSGGGDHDPAWAKRIEAQADALFWMQIPHTRPWLDYACGNGALATALTRRGLYVQGYEPYLQDLVWDGLPMTTEPHPGVFDCVIATSILEHVRSMDQVRAMADLVSNDGVFAFHTFVGDVRPDPTWYYLLPTHCTLWSPTAINILLQEYGFRDQVYDEPADLHVWYR